MDAGRFLQIGPPAEIYEAPASRFVADFIGNVNLMDGTVAEHAPGHVVVDCGDVRHRVAQALEGGIGTAVTVALRPEKIRIARDVDPVAGEGLPIGPNSVRGTVKDLAYFGSYTVYHLQLAGGRVLKISQSNTERQGSVALTWGDAARANWSEQVPMVLTR
jgi:putrescine transport system ATP-binding protein